MPTSAVYQPTTVTFGDNGGGSLLSQTTTTSRLRQAFRKPWTQALLLAAALLFLALGLILTSVAFADYEDVVANEDVVTDLPVNEKRNDIIFIFLGGFFTIFGLVLLGEWNTLTFTYIRSSEHISTFCCCI